MGAGGDDVVKNVCGATIENTQKIDSHQSVRGLQIYKIQAFDYSLIKNRTDISLEVIIYIQRL